MLDQSAANTGIHPRQALVDAGYCSETNLEAANERQLSCGTDTFMATGPLGHDEQVPPAPRGLPKNATPKERMARKPRNPRSQSQPRVSIKPGTVHPAVPIGPEAALPLFPVRAGPEAGARRTPARISTVR